MQVRTRQTLRALGAVVKQKVVIIESTDAYKPVSVTFFNNEHPSWIGFHYMRLYR